MAARRAYSPAFSAGFSFCLPGFVPPKDDFKHGQVERNFIIGSSGSLSSSLKLLKLNVESWMASRMKILLPISLLLSFIFTAISKGQELSQEIASTLGYPHERLTISDRSSEYAEKSKGDYLFVVQLKSEDGTFAPTELAISKRGIILSPKQEEYYNKTIADHPGIIRRFDLEQGGYGYAGIAIRGPGGSEERVTATWPERGIDLLVKVRLVRDELVPDDSVRGYQDLVIDGGKLVDEKLIASLNHLAAYAEKQKLYISNEAVSRPSSIHASAANTAREMQRQNTEGLANRSELFVVIGLIGAMLLLFAGYKIFKRRV